MFGKGKKKTEILKEILEARQPRDLPADVPAFITSPNYGNVLYIYISYIPFFFFNIIFFMNSLRFVRVYLIFFILNN